MLTFEELRDTYGWFIKNPRKTRKLRLQKKWLNQFEAQRRECFECDHDWRKRRNPPEGERTFDLICAKCRSISYTVNEEYLSKISPTSCHRSEPSRGVMPMPDYTGTVLTVALKGELFSFHSETHWANKAKSWYATCGVPPHRILTLDGMGRVCVSGKEFMRATAENTYPVTAYEIL